MMKTDTITKTKCTMNALDTGGDSLWFSLMKKGGLFIGLLLVLAAVAVMPSGASAILMPEDPFDVPPWNITDSMPAVSGYYKLMNDVLISETWLVPDGGMYLDLNGYTLRLVDGADGSVINIIGPKTGLELHDNSNKKTGTITGGNASEFGGGVSIQGGGHLTQFGGNIVDNIAVNGGGGVGIINGTYQLASGNILNNSAYNGGGVYVATGSSSFEMYGGSISHNTAEYGGSGVSVENQGLFNLIDGTITGNAARRSGGGVSVNYGGNFTLAGGTITGNTAMWYGGGVYVDSGGNFVQVYGNITGNTASNGGGVYVDNDGNFVQTYGNITGNMADYDGGGVYVARGSFTITDGTITGNAARRSGGGVSVNYGGNFTLAGGNITCNTADYGGGVYVDNDGNFIQDYGTITGNAAMQSGDGVYVFSGTFRISDNAIVDANNDVYLYTDIVINVTGHSFTGSVLNITGSSLNVGKTVVSIDDGSSILASDIISQFKLQNPALTLEAGDDDKTLVVGSGGDGGITDQLPTESGSYYLLNDIDIYSTWIIPEGVEITLDLRGHDITMTGSGSVIRVNSGANLTITDTSAGEHGKITGGNAESGGGVCVNGSNFAMYGGTITGNTAYWYGGGVCVSDGNFTISGGTITGNTAYYGGGVYVSDGNFTISGGTITGNTARNGGGGVCVYNEVNFTMYGGSIQNNTAESTGGGVYATTSTLALYDGNITGNTVSESAGGVYTNCCNFTMYGGNINDNRARGCGGVCDQLSTFVMYGGNINNNTADDHSGGICVDGHDMYGVFEMYGGNVNGNSANEGGGVSIIGGTFMMHGGNISNNMGIIGGGVWNWYGTFTLIDGNISDNIANSGGGVYVSGRYIDDTLIDGIFTMCGGNINENYADYNGGGVYVLNGTTFMFSGGNVTDNVVSGSPENVYLQDGSTITIDENRLSLIENAIIGVTTELKPEVDNSIAITSESNANYSQHFVSDNPEYYIENNNNVIYLVSSSFGWPMFVSITLGNYMSIDDSILLEQGVESGYPITDIVITADSGYYFDTNNYPSESGLVFTVSADGHTLTISGIPRSDIFKTLADALPESVGPVVPTYHNVTFNITGHGTAFADPEAALAGDLVMIEVIPDDGYELSGIYPYGVDDFYQSGNISFEFTMPDNEVLIDVFFRNIAVEPIITIDVPEGNISAEGTTTIPVTIHNAEDIILFSFEVFNDSLNADIAINKTYEPLRGFYEINNNNDPCILAWFSTNGFSGNQTLFAIDVTPRDSISSDSPYINLSICVREMYTLDVVDVKPQYPMIFGTVRVDVRDIPTPTPTPTPTPVEPTSSLPTNISLQNGWNFISVAKYLDQSCETAYDLFAGVDTGGTSIIGYDSRMGWYTLTRDTAIKPLEGYWIYAATPSVIDLTYYSGTSPKTPPTKAIYYGWNAVGLCANEPMTAKVAFSGLSWQRYLPWDLTKSKWGRPIVKGGSAENSEENYISLGNAGWLYAEADGLLVGNAA